MVLDGSSKKVLVWNLVFLMMKLGVGILITKMKALYLNSASRIICDDGAQFVDDNFRNLLTLFGMATKSLSLIWRCYGHKIIKN